MTALGFGSAKSNAPGGTGSTNIATTIAGEPSRIASVSGLRASVSNVRSVSTDHWRTNPRRVAPAGGGRSRCRGVGTVVAVAAVGETLRPLLGRLFAREAFVDFLDALDAEVRERVVGRADEREVAVASEDDDAVAVGEVLHRVRGEDDRAPSSASSRSSRSRPLPSPGPAPRSARRGRRRADGEQLDADACALALSAGQRAHPHLRTVGEAECHQHARRRGVELAPRGPHPEAVAAPRRQGPLEWQVQVDDVVLRDVPERGRGSVEIQRRGDAVVEHLPRRGTHAREGVEGVVFPAPLPPTTSTSPPDGTVKERCRSTHRPIPSTFRRSRATISTPRAPAPCGDP